MNTINRKAIETALMSERIDRAWGASVTSLSGASGDEKMEALCWIRERRLAVFWAMDATSGHSVAEVYELTYAQLCSHLRLLETQQRSGYETTLRTMLLSILLEAMEEPLEYATVNRIHGGLSDRPDEGESGRTELARAA